MTRDSFVSKSPVDQIVEIGSKEEKPEIPSQDQTNKPDSTQNQEAKSDAPLQTPERKETAVLPNTGTATDSAFLLGLLTALTGLFLFKKREE